MKLGIFNQDGFVINFSIFKIDLNDIFKKNDKTSVKLSKNISTQLIYNLMHTQ